MNNRRVAVKALFPLPCNNVGISHICALVCRHMQTAEVSLELMAPRVGLGHEQPFIRAFLPRLSAFVPFRMIRRHCLPALERSFLRLMEPGDLAYLWSSVSLDLARILKDRGIPVIREKFNCHQATSRRIQDRAYAGLGLAAGHSITEQGIAKEHEELALADFVFCPSPMVAKSLREEGVAEEKLIATSFGWDPERFEGSGAMLPPIDGITVLFVGAVCVRKGVHILLEAWSRAGIKGRLLLAGAVEPALATRCAEQFNRKDVSALGHVTDLRACYRSADIFAFPSLEEGGPLVTYEAAAHSLPMVVSPMGAGAFIGNEKHGIVVEPDSVDRWVDALRRLAASEELRKLYGAAAHVHAQNFTWQRVGQSRAQSLVQLARAGRTQRTGSLSEMPHAAAAPT